MDTRSQTAPQVTVVIADDDPVVRELVAAVIEADGSLDLVARAEDTASAIEAVVMHDPDVAVIDWVMPGGGGAAATARIRSECPNTGVVALTAEEGEDARLDMMRAGAMGFLVKGGPPAELIETIHTVARLHRERRPKPLVARTWRGVVRRADAETYARYIRDTGFGEYSRTAGNRGAWMLRRDEGDTTEFITLSLWESEDAIRAFAGDDIEAAVLYPEDERFLIGESTVTHHEVVDEAGG